MCILIFFCADRILTGRTILVANILTRLRGLHEGIPGTRIAWLEAAAGTPAMAEYCCLDYFTADLVCLDCCMRQRQRHPLHIIEVRANFVGVVFSLIFRRSEQERLLTEPLSNPLGLNIYLNHASMQCPIDVACHRDFLFLHTNGVTRCVIDWLCV